VHSLDWLHPTAGENTAGRPRAPSDEGSDARSQVERLELQSRCADQLRGNPHLLTEWTTLLALAQKYARIREEQADNLTLAWPLLRVCVRRLGEALTIAGTLDDPELVFFLTREELDQATPLTDPARRRQQQWRRQRRLSPPLTIGTPPPLIGRHLADTLGAASPDETDHQIHGQPASPGRATGPARIVHTLDDFTKVTYGDVIVAAATTPSWTPLFKLAVAVVTDRGTAAAHASLIAREYGIPAVVATRDATRRITDGTQVTVDGTRGVVSIVD
jgi:pyruvate,water dikinase